MCGIAGIFNTRRVVDDRMEQINRMVGALLHRGPDEQGIYLDDHVALGHARLSIIDLAGGTQPIHNEDHSVWIVYNGEVFNYPELRADLEAKGHRFYTRTDTEVIVHLYEEHGLDCFSLLTGQFAIALWDRSRHQVILARDRVGIRPLYYTRRPDSVFFASEIKALAATGAVPLAINPQAIAQVLTFWTPLPGQSFLSPVSEVPPGCYAVLDEESLQIHRYWQWPCPTADDLFAGSREALVEELREVLEDAIRIRLRADVPVGSYVSGGLDSSGVSAITLSKFNPNLHTFGIRFEDDSFDEGVYQEAMVSWLGTEHSTLTAGGRSIGQAFVDCVEHVEQPILRTAPVPLFMLSKVVRDAGFKVVLTGEGADEVFGGYNIFREAKVRRFWARRPESTMRPMLLRRLYPYIFKNPRLTAMTEAFFGQGLARADDPLFSHMLRWSEAEQRRQLLSADMQDTLASYQPVDELRGMLPADFARTDWLNRAQVLEATLFMSQYLLSAQGDRPAMAHSVEIRLPFLDHRLIELAARIPAPWKIRGLNEKQILKDMLAPRLPAKILEREKHPYRAPVRDALLGSDAVRSFLTPEALTAANIFDTVKVGNLLQKMSTAANPSERDSMNLAGIASTQVLHHLFISEQNRETRPFAPALLIDRRGSTT